MMCLERGNLAGADVLTFFREVSAECSSPAAQAGWAGTVFPVQGAVWDRPLVVRAAGRS